MTLRLLSAVLLAVTFAACDSAMPSPDNGSNQPGVGQPSNRPKSKPVTGPMIPRPRAER